MTVKCPNCESYYDLRFSACPHCEETIEALPGIGDSIGKLKLPPRQTNILRFEMLKTIGDLYRLEFRKGLMSLGGFGEVSYHVVEKHLREYGYKTLAEVRGIARGDIE